MWTGVILKHSDYSALNPNQKVNQIPKFTEITKKHNLFSNLT